MRFIVIIPFIILTTSGCVGMAVRAIAQPSKPDLSQLLEKADANGDGIITRSEFADARTKMFDRLDRNHDGYLSKDDKPRFSLGQSGKSDRLQQAILMLDNDGDGKVSREEFINGPSRLFERADANHDGVVDAGELAGFKARMNARTGN